MDREDAESFVKELDAWHDMIGRQKEQLPELSEMLDRTIHDRREADEEMLSNAESLRNSIRAQEECMQRLRDALSLQMRFLSERSNGRRMGFRIETNQRQSRLRDEVRNVEKRYFELKSILMNYVWSVTWRR
ncbi:MAG: hypothetical protein EBZ67_10160 [Chitinophagia bacterium]|nr:hypothetical protein [Chitinophagia bacterium]